MIFEAINNPYGDPGVDLAMTLELASFERRRQRLLPDDDPNKIKGLSRGYPLYDCAVMAQKRLAQIQRDISLREYIPYDEVDERSILDTYIAECIFGEAPTPDGTGLDQLVEFAGQRVEYEESDIVCRGVMCHVYKYKETDEEDLAIVDVKPGASTPKQRILEGESTLEGYVRGEGVLLVEDADGVVTQYNFDEANQTVNPVAVNIGQTMQWVAGANGLTFSEVCRPPYSDGRFEEL